MTTWPVLDLVIPCRDKDDPLLAQFLASLQTQTYPAERMNVHLMFEGNPEEAKAYGIQACQGDVIGLFCTDNRLTYDGFLEEMVRATLRPDVIGAYTFRYAYDENDPILNRYFALLGANDPLCWWLEKADRYDYATYPETGVQHFPEAIPSIGDNGFFIKRQALQLVVKDPAQHFCIDAIEDLRRLGLYSYNVVPTYIHHQTGSSWSAYFQRRYRYVAELYFRDFAKRRWRMIDTRQDWLGLVSFVAASLLVLPHLPLVIAGYRKVPDKAWFLHPVICWLLVWVYGWAWLRHRLPQLLSFRRSTAR